MIIVALTLNLFMPLKNVGFIYFGHSELHSHNPLLSASVFARVFLVLLSSARTALKSLLFTTAASSEPLIDVTKPPTAVGDSSSMDFTKPLTYSNVLSIDTNDKLVCR